MKKVILSLSLLLSFQLHSQNDLNLNGNFRYENNTIIDIKNNNSIVETNILNVDTVSIYDFLLVQTKNGISFGEDKWIKILIDNIVSYEYEFYGDFVYLNVKTKDSELKIDLLHERITQIPIDANLVRNLSEVKNSNKVYLLDLSKKNYKKIPKKIFNFENLGELKIYSNSIESLSSSVAKLEKLEVLEISNNKLKSLPKEIGMLKNLYQLGLSNNNLTDLPAEIKNLTKLKNLDLKSNNFSASKKAEIMKWFENTACKVDFGDNDFEGEN